MPVDAGTYRPPAVDAAIAELSECRAETTDAQIGALVVIADEYVEGSRTDLEQVLTTSVFDVAYANHGTLTGIVDFHVAGGPVEYDAHFSWNDTSFPERR
jgi:hypothetical protein